MDVKTKLLILSDTHAQSGLVVPDLAVDVAIHCGDLTDESKLHEFRAAIDLLREIKATLKLVIAGNHDFTLDTPTYEEKITRATRVCSIEPELMKKTYGDIGEARQLISDLTSDNIVFLDEGTHCFNLDNGAKLRVYASPFTASAEADWGFQFKRGEHHNFAVQDVDIAITHSPPKGVLDRTDSGQRGGCEHLFAAIAKARPKMHCFGHIHEGWGAKLVTWKGETASQEPSHFSDIDNAESMVLENLATLQPGRWDSDQVIAEKKKKLQMLKTKGYCWTSHCEDNGGHGDQGNRTLRVGKQTLFVNAAIESLDDESQLPWVVEIGLPPADPALS